MRQMGGAYLYSFDITVLLLGACFNLAGLPYSAGFIGKEFLLFQVLRDDFISLFVRGCWLVSFFFTPIYMFVLVFLVMFGPKKGFIHTYSSGWDSNTLPANNATLVQTGVTYSASKYSRFQFTIITSRLTTYVLFSFWIFFFFFGESLLLLTLNYSSTVDTITSHSFFVVKQHIIFYLNSGSGYLLNQINFFIYFLTSSAIVYLLNLNFRSQYWLLRHTFTNTCLVSSVVLFSYLWM